MCDHFGQYRKDINTVYQLLGDEQSKFIYGRRLLYSLTGDEAVLQDMVDRVVRSRREWQAFRKELSEKAARNKMVIYGAGIWGHILWEETKDIINWDLCVDAAPEGKEFPVRLWKLADFIKVYNGEYVAVSSFKNQDSMYARLLEGGVPAEKIIHAGQVINEMTEGSAYFDLKELGPLKEKEVFVDGGCYDGFTTRAFFQWAGKTGYAYCFEIDQENRKAIRRNLPAGNYEILPKALWSERRILSLTAAGNFASSVAEDVQEGSACVEADTIDSLLWDKGVTYIKMDIEGAELAAIKGAEKVIREQSPRLAVSIYHKPEDIFQIPALLHKFHKDYRFYLRHYSFSYYDTVLYAVI